MTQTTVAGIGEYSLAAEYLITVRDFALKKGINAKTLLHNSDIGLETLLNPPARIADYSMHMVGRNLIKALENPLAHAIEYGRSMALSNHGVLGIAAQGAPNILEAARIMEQYFRTRATSKQMEHIEEPSLLRMRFAPDTWLDHDSEPGAADELVTAFFNLAILINLEQICRDLLETANISGKAIINMACQEPEEFPYHLVADRIDIFFDQPYSELAVPIEWCNIPLKAANPELSMAATDQCENELAELAPKDLLTEVRLRIRESHAFALTIEDAAEQFSMSVSTLQRRLKSQNTTFQLLKGEERQTLAKELLINSTDSMETISDRLGFSDASNFTKAFKNWLNTTPNNYRKSSPDHQQD